MPHYLRQPVDVFRVDADGVYDVDFEVANDGVRIRDTLSRVGIYVASREKATRNAILGKRHRVLDLHQRKIGFDPAHNDVDFEILEGLLDLPQPRSKKPLRPELEQQLTWSLRSSLRPADVWTLDVEAEDEIIARCCAPFF